MRILLLGDVVGAPGLAAIEAWLPQMRAAWSVDVAVVNGENAAFEGKGMPPMAVRRLFAAGADVVTGGNHSLRCREVEPLLAREPRLIMPVNAAQRVGKGVATLTVAGVPVVVVQVQGQAMMPGRCSSPFAAADVALAEARGAVGVVDVHAETSSEKQALAWHLAGRAAAVVGTHTHTPTADARLLGDGTAYQTDLGMCGPYDSVIGFEPEAAISRFVTGERIDLPVARASDVRLAGAVVDVDAQSRRATRIVSIQVAKRAPVWADLPPFSLDAGAF